MNEHIFSILSKFWINLLFFNTFLPNICFFNLKNYLLFLHNIFKLEVNVFLKLHTTKNKMAFFLSHTHPTAR